MDPDATSVPEVRTLSDGRSVASWRPPGPPSINGVDRPTLVLLHGGLDAVTTLRDLPAALAAATGCPVIAYDRAGHGRSTGPPSTLAEPVCYRHVEADALPRLFAELGLDRPVLVGHSDGAAVALLGAGRHPDRVAGVVALAPQLVFHPGMRSGLDAAAQAFANGDLRARLQRHHRGAPPAGVDAVFAGWARAWRSEGLTAASVEDDLRAIRCPVSVVVGRQDPYGHRPNVLLLAASLDVPWQLEVADGVGHNPHHDARAAVLTVVGRFLAERYGTGANVSVPSP